VLAQLPVLFSEEHPLLTGFSRELFAFVQNLLILVKDLHSMIVSIKHIQPSAEVESFKMVNRMSDFWGNPEL
jgi:hypothetical protein